MTRREAREQAFVLLFEESFHEGETLSEIIEAAAEGRSVEVDPFAYKLASGAIGHLAIVDEQIESCSTKWKKNRLSRVALAILRLSAYELLFAEDIPDKVSINEAVELAKKFGSEEDGSFVNGVLGAIERAKEGKPLEDIPSEDESPEGKPAEEHTEEISVEDKPAEEKPAEEAGQE